MVKAEESSFITLATTTSTENSGILAYLNPIFTKETGIDVRVVARGSGVALDVGRKGDADVLMVHSPEAEETFVAEGWGTKRYTFMHNDFVLLGPAADPAQCKGIEIVQALKKLSEAKAVFISRGDESGTHVKEKALWKAAAIDPKGDWYLCIGQGMGKTLLMASEKSAYTLSDRGTYLSMTDKLQSIVISEGSDLLANPYTLIPVSPQKFPSVKNESAMKYINWLMSDKGQKLIGEFKVDGKQLFIPGPFRGKE